MRTFILVLSICLASAMLFASLTLSKTLVELQRDSYKASVGTADIVVLSKEKQFFELTDLNCNEVATDCVIPKLNVTGLFDKRTQLGSLFFQINGFDYDDIQNFNPIEFDKVDNKSFEGKEVIIGSYTAEKLGLDIGSEFEISINDVKYNFNVYGIAKKTGLFAFDGQRYSAIIPITTLREMLKLPQESVSELYVVLKTDVDKENALQKLSDENPELKVDYNYLDFRSFDFEGTEAEKKECIEKLDSGKNIIMTYMLMDKYDLKENDIVSLETNDGKVDYTVVGSFYSMLESGGNYALISEENLKEDFNIVNYSQFYIKSEDPAIETKLFLEFPNDNISITSIDELIEVSKKSSEQKTNIFNGLSCVVIIICFGAL